MKVEHHLRAAVEDGVEHEEEQLAPVRPRAAQDVEVVARGRARGLDRRVACAPRRLLHDVQRRDEREDDEDEQHEELEQVDGHAHQQQHERAELGREVDEAQQAHVERQHLPGGGGTPL